MDKIIPLCSKDTSLGMVFCFYNCSDPLWGKSVLVIENYWKKHWDLETYMNKLEKSRFRNFNLFTIFGSIEVGVVGEVIGICCEIDETGGCNLGSTFIYSGLVKSVVAPPPGPAVPAGGEVGGREVMLGVTGSKMGGAAGAAGGDTGGTSWPGVVGSINEFITCFSES